MRISKKDISLHDAGATIRHQSPFHNLPIWKNKENLTEDFLTKWVMPFYMVHLPSGHADFLKALRPIYSELNLNIVKQLLGEFNWRPRIVGAYFSALKLYYEVEDNIGKLFLRSDVCLAGKGYCLAFASFNNEKAERGFIGTLSPGGRGRGEGETYKCHGRPAREVSRARCSSWPC